MGIPSSCQTATAGRMQDFYSPEAVPHVRLEIPPTTADVDFLGHVASLDNLRDPQGATKKVGRLGGPCEPNMVQLGDGRLVWRHGGSLTMTATPSLRSPPNSYHDLFVHRSGDGFIPARSCQRFYTIGEPGSPGNRVLFRLMARHGRRRSLAQARGCFPRMACPRCYRAHHTALGLSSMGKLRYVQHGRRQVLERRGQFRSFPDDRVHGHPCHWGPEVPLRLRLHSPAALEEPRCSLGGRSRRHCRHMNRRPSPLF